MCQSKGRVRLVREVDQQMINHAAMTRAGVENSTPSDPSRSVLSDMVQIVNGIDMISYQGDLESVRDKVSGQN